MKTLLEKYEFVKETQYVFEGIDDKIISRIYKVLIPKAIDTYEWRISHYCRQDSQMDIYYPSKLRGTLEEVEFQVDLYIDNFPKAIELEKNIYF